jgi:hypothetical protein
VKTLAEWAPHLERAGAGVSIRALRGAIDVAGWERDDWRSIHESLPIPA